MTDIVDDGTMTTESEGPVPGNWNGRWVWFRLGNRLCLGRVCAAGEGALTVLGFDSTGLAAPCLEVFEVRPDDVVRTTSRNDVCDTLTGRCLDHRGRLMTEMERGLRQTVGTRGCDPEER